MSWSTLWAATMPRKPGHAKFSMPCRLPCSQVINEAIAVFTGKQRFTQDEAYEVAKGFMKLVAVAPVTATTVSDAMEIGLRYGISHWDALIVAAAIHSGCDTLYSEDMQHGQVFNDRLTVANPFA